MKKKFYLISFLIFFLSFNLFAQNEDLKYYYDSSKGFKGYSVAVFLESLEDDEELSSEDYFDLIMLGIETTISPVKKITKQNNWLLNNAMNEWDYVKDEVYFVICSESKNADNFLLFFVFVKGRNDYKWKAFEISSDTDFDNLFSDF